MQNTNRKSATVNVSNKKDFGMFRKMIIQITICIVIYGGFYIIQNTNYIFSQDVIQKVKQILSYDINIKKLYEQGIEYLNGFINNVGVDAHIDPQNEIEQNGLIENQINKNEIIESLMIEDTNSIQQENIGGENIEGVEINEEETVQLTQMEQDAKDILDNKSLIIPLKGTITSRYGLRDPDTPTVPKNHTGIDIAVNEGTVFVAAMSGIVEEVSSERRFRKSF